MPILSLVCGSLCKPPEAKVSRAGKPFVTASLRAAQGNDTIFIRVTAFEAVSDDLLALKVGDAVSCVGVLNVDIYQDRPSFSMIVTRVLALKKEKRSPKPKQARDEPGVDHFDDDIPPL